MTRASTRRVGRRFCRRSTCLLALLVTSSLGAAFAVAAVVSARHSVDRAAQPLSISAKPPSRTVEPGASARFAVRVARRDREFEANQLGLRGRTDLSVVNALPSGANVSFTPQRGLASRRARRQTTTLTVTTAANTPPGTYRLWVHARRPHRSGGTAIRLVVTHRSGSSAAAKRAPQPSPLPPDAFAISGELPESLTPGTGASLNLTLANREDADLSISDLERRGGGCQRAALRPDPPLRRRRLSVEQFSGTPGFTLAPPRAPPLSRTQLIPLRVAPGLDAEPASTRTAANWPRSRSPSRATPPRSPVRRPPPEAPRGLIAIACRRLVAGAFAFWRQAAAARRPRSPTSRAASNPARRRAALARRREGRDGRRQPQPRIRAGRLARPSSSRAGTLRGRRRARRLRPGGAQLRPQDNARAGWRVPPAARQRQAGDRDAGGDDDGRRRHERLSGRRIQRAAGPSERAPTAPGGPERDPAIPGLACQAALGYWSDVQARRRRARRGRGDPQPGSGADPGRDGGGESDRQWGGSGRCNGVAADGSWSSATTGKPALGKSAQVPGTMAAPSCGEPDPPAGKGIP